MKNMIIEATNYSPLVEFYPDGKMVIRGRSILDDTLSFYKPLLELITQCNSSKFFIEMNIELMNTNSLKHILKILSEIKRHFGSENCEIHWYYEKGDEDMIDIGKFFETILQKSFHFYEMSESEDVRFLQYV